jgi:hypothetical protein
MEHEPNSNPYIESSLVPNPELENCWRLTYGISGKTCETINQALRFQDIDINELNRRSIQVCDMIKNCETPDRKADFFILNEKHIALSRLTPFGVGKATSTDAQHTPVVCDIPQESYDSLVAFMSRSPELTMDQVLAEVIRLQSEMYEYAYAGFIVAAAGKSRRVRTINMLDAQRDRTEQNPEAA